VIHPALFALAVAALMAVSARAQTPPASLDQRLDRIDGKLDEILRRLNAASTPAGGQAAPSPAAAAPAVPDTAAAKASYQPGAVAIVHAAPDKPRDLQAIPADSVGGFVYDGGPVALNDLHAKGVRYAGLAGLELQGWLKVTAAGRTQLAVEYRATTGGNAVIPPSCLATAWLEDRAIGAETGQIPVPAREEKTIDLILGADLQPGLYRLRLWTACTPTRDLKLNAEVLLKNPADMNLRPVTAVDLLHQGG
jgi:hypothetical protein